MKSSRSDFPVFVVGAPRSGTTLVYSLLLATGEFVEYEEGETRLLQCRYVYGPLSRDSCRARFAEDWLKSAQFKRSGLDPEDFRDVLAREPDSYVELLRAFMQLMAEDQDKPRWAEKTPANIHHMHELADAFPEARFVHVIRDGRDVALSRRKLGWHVVRSDDPVRQLVGAAVHWAGVITSGRAAGRSLDGRYHEVQYEDLIRRTDEEIVRLMSFADSHLADCWRDQPSSGALQSGFSAFSSEISGLSTDPLERWRDRLSDEELAATHSTIGGTLRDLGYQVAPGAATPWDRLTATAYGSFVRLWLAVKRLVRRHTPLRRLRSPRLLDSESG